MVLKWRSVLARERRRPPGFILPCKPVLSQQISTGAEWIHELKWDGYRIIARRDGEIAHLWSQAGRNWADTFSWIVDAMGRLPVESVVLDGEAVCLLDDGRPDFHALRSKEGCRNARLITFDLLVLTGEDLRRSRSASAASASPNS